MKEDTSCEGAACYAYVSAWPVGEGFRGCACAIGLRDFSLLSVGETAAPLTSGERGGGRHAPMDNRLKSPGRKRRTH